MLGLGLVSLDNSLTLEFHGSPFPVNHLRILLISVASKSFFSKKALDILAQAQVGFLIGGEMEDFGIALVRGVFGFESNQGDLFVDWLLECFLAEKTLGSFHFWGDPYSHSNPGSPVRHSSYNRYNHRNQYRLVPMRL